MSWREKPGEEWTKLNVGRWGTEAGRFARKSIRPTVIRPKWTMFRPIVIDVSPDISESMKIGIEILSNGPSKN